MPLTRPFNGRTVVITRVTSLGVCMNCLLVLRTKVPAVALGCILFLTSNGSLVAQTTGTVNPDPAVDPSGKEAPPTGDCMPIGITVSGEVVFPLQCRDFIERLKAADRKAAAPGENHNDASGKPAIEDKPVATEEKTAANREESIGPENTKPADVSGKPAIGAKPVATEEKTVANKEESLAPANSKPTEKPVAKAPVENRNVRKPREQAAGPPGCVRFRSYDPASGTYRSYDGRRRSCGTVDRAAMVK